MFNSTSLSLALFRWSVFCLLCYKCYQLIKLYAIPKLHQAISEEQQQVAALMHKDKLAMIAKQKIENQIHQQNQLLTVLEYNMRRWHQSLLTETERDQQALTALIAFQEAKYAQQQQQLFISQSLQAVIPQALAQATAKLSELYGNDNAKLHLDSLITDLNTARRTQ